MDMVLAGNSGTTTRGEEEREGESVTTIRYFLSDETCQLPEQFRYSKSVIMDNHNAANDLIKLNGYWINERFRDRHGSYMRVLSSLIIPTDRKLCFVAVRFIPTNAKWVLVHNTILDTNQPRPLLEVLRVFIIFTSNMYVRIYVCSNKQYWLQCRQTPLTIWAISFVLNVCNK